MNTHVQILRSAVAGSLILVAGLVLAAAVPDLTPAQLDSIWTSGERDEALSSLESALNKARTRGDDRAVITFLNREAAWRKTVGQPVVAEEAAREALDIALASGDSSLACAPIRWLGVALTAQGRNEEARQQYARLLDLATRVKDHEHRGWANIGLGWDDDLNRRSQQSFDHYTSAAACFREAGDPEGELWGQLGAANARFHLGQYEAAAQGWDQVAKTAAVAGLPRHEASTLNNIAALQFALGRPDVSTRYYERAIAVWDSLAQPYESLPPRLNLGSCLALLGQDDRARDLFEEILVECREGEFRNYEARALRRLAKLDRVEGDLPGAMARFEAIVDMGDDLPLLEVVEALRGQASLLNGEGRYEEALAVLHEVERRLEADETSAHRTRLDLDLADTLLRLGRTDEARIHLQRADASMGTARARHGQQLAVMQATCWERAGEPDSALAVLDETADLWEAERDLPLDPDWREERGAVGRSVFTRLARHLARSEGVPAAFDRLQVYKARTLRERRRGPEALPEAVAVDDPTVTDLITLQAEVLHPGELLLDTYLGPEHSLMFAVTRDSCRLVKLPPDTELAPQLRRWQQALADPNQPTDGLGWADSLLTPIQDLLAGSTHLISAPDGEFNLLPLAALLSAGSRMIVTRVPSATVLVDLRQEREVDTEPSSILVLHAGELPAAAWESAHLAARYANVSTHSIVDDTPATLAELVSESDVIHVAAHAQGDDRNAWQSAIVCDPDRVDGRWRARDITALSLTTRLAVLASCRSAAGRMLSGEGVQGLAAAFVAAGVPSVVAALWPVDDDATAFFMAHFYENLAAGETVGGALVLAQTACREDAIFNDPACWSGFVLIGDGEQVMALPSRRAGGNRWWWFLGLLLPVLLVLRRRR